MGGKNNSTFEALVRAKNLARSNDTADDDRLKQALIRKTADWWGSPIVARSQVGKLTGGGISPGTCANADAAGVGPPPSARLIGPKKCCYLVEPFLAWFFSRYKFVGAEVKNE